MKSHYSAAQVANSEHLKPIINAEKRRNIYVNICFCVVLATAILCAVAGSLWPQTMYWLGFVGQSAILLFFVWAFVAAFQLHCKAHPTK